MKIETVTRYRDDKGHYAKAPEFKARNALGDIDHKADSHAALAETAVLLLLILAAICLSNQHIWEMCVKIAGIDV